MRAWHRLSSLTENIDATTSGGKLVFHIFGALAEFEREIIRERTQAGLETATDRGRKGGRPKALADSKVQMTKQLYAEKTHTGTEDVDPSPGEGHQHLGVLLTLGSLAVIESSGLWGAAQSAFVSLVEDRLEKLVSPRIRWLFPFRLPESWAAGTRSA